MSTLDVCMQSVDHGTSYDTSGCNSQGFSWSPSNRFLNRSKLASTRLCNNHIIYLEHLASNETGGAGPTLAPFSDEEQLPLGAVVRDSNGRCDGVIVAPQRVRYECICNFRRCKSCAAPSDSLHHFQTVCIRVKFTPCQYTAQDVSDTIPYWKAHYLKRQFLSPSQTSSRN